MGDNLIGLTGADYVLIAADSATSRSIVLMKENEDKIMHLDSHKLLAASGPTGDREHFTEFIQRNLELYQLRQGHSLSNHAAAHFTRGELATALRSNPYQVNLLLGGFDKEQGPSLYFIDYLASLQKLDFACQGYAGYFVLSIFDRHYRKGMNLEEGLQLLRLCLEQLKTRMVLNSVSFIIKVVDKDGIRVLDAGKQPSK
jgi:20S proteasome subunit beta 4